ncbi:DUF1642 domain-containing protein [Carnobacterium jeotgali]|uniref:DUF1642 domain-containing protein n=1 Tax=Carnobacterium jeotgali TaxID=545534 RepID=UPI0038904F79
MTEQQPTIPQFIADWIVSQKQTGMNIYGALSELYKHKKVSTWSNNVDDTLTYKTLCDAWFYGYKIESSETDEIVDKLVRHIQSDDFEDILRSSVRAFIIRDGIK